MKEIQDYKVQELSSLEIERINGGIVTCKEHWGWSLALNAIFMPLGMLYDVDHYIGSQ